MQSFFKTVYQLDAQDKLQELLEFVQRPTNDFNEMYLALSWLLTGKRLRPAYILAMLLANHGILNYTIAVVLAAGGLQFNNPIEQERGVAWLHAHAGSQGEDKRLPHFYQVVFPALAPDLKEAVATGNQERVSHLFSLLTIAVPSLKERFAHSLLPDWSLKTQRQAGQSRFHGDFLGQRSTRNAPLKRRVMVVERSKIFPKTLWPNYPWDAHGSRMDPHLMAEFRLLTALKGLGWPVESCLIESVETSLDCRAILEACQRQQTQILIIDDRLVLAGQTQSEPRQRVSEMLWVLKQTIPDFKVVMTLLDVEVIQETLLIEMAPLLDGIWGPTSMVSSIWSHPALAHKVLHLPLPHLGHEIPANHQPLDATLWLDEPVTHYRQFWLEAARALELPIQVKEGIRHIEPVMPEQRYAIYRQELAATRCCLRFCAEPEQPGQVTDRSFATLLGGSLLIQETPSELDRYFIPGEHFLEFSSLAQLKAIADFIANNPDEAESIRCAGHAFAHEHYSDTRLIDHLEALLYPLQPLDEPQQTSTEPASLGKELITFEYLSVYHWCQPATPEELLTKPGNLVCRFDAHKRAQPPLDLGLHLRGEGYEDLFPCTDEQVAAFIYYYDFRTRATAPLTPFVAKLENVRIEFPGFGVFLDRHFLLEESYHHKRRTEETITWFGNVTKRRIAHMDLSVAMATSFGSPIQTRQMPLDVNYYINNGVDQFIKGPAMMLSGPSWANWYHWFVEMLPRVWAIQAIPGLEEIPLICRAPLFSYQRESLQALGIAPERIQLFTGNCLQVETLIFPSPLSPENYVTNNISWLKETLLPGFGINTAIPPTELIYLSREQLEGRPTRTINEEALLGPLQARGFKVVYPEQMSVKEQLELFNRTRFLIAPFGSGGTNIVFCQPGTIFIELMSVMFPQFLNMYYASLNQCHYGCIMSSIGDPEGLEMMVDVDGLMRVVDKILLTDF